MKREAVVIFTIVYLLWSNFNALYFKTAWLVKRDPGYWKDLKSAYPNFPNNPSIFWNPWYRFEYWHVYTLFQYFILVIFVLPNNWFTTECVFLTFIMILILFYYFLKWYRSSIVPWFHKWMDNVLILCFFSLWITR